MRSTANPPRSPEEIVHSAFAAAEREQCLAFMAYSIEAIKAIDPEALAVIDIPSSKRFRVYCGPGTACSAWKRMLDVTIDSRKARGLMRRIEVAGGKVLFDSPGAHSKVPGNAQIAVPPARVEEFREELMEAHHIYLNLAANQGRSAYHGRHRPDLEAFILRGGGGASNDSSD